MSLVGLALVFLLAGIAWLVTRWVVVPVARAAQGAQLLSTGKLDERLAVRGDDEMAALATSFNEMAASLQEKMRELEELSQVQRQFVSDVSHELRTPLTTIRMAADLLYEAREQLESRLPASAELLQSQLGRFESLLVDLLEISRYDANAATLDAELVDVCDVVRQSADVAQQLAERRGARIEFRLPAEPCVVEVDRRRVERILRNLLVQRRRARRGQGRGRDLGRRPRRGGRRRCVTSASAWRQARSIWSSTGSGGPIRPGPGRPAAPGSASPSPWRTPGCTAAGSRPGASLASGSVFRLTLPRAVGAELAGSPLPLRARRDRYVDPGRPRRRGPERRSGSRMAAPRQ